MGLIKKFRMPEITPESIGALPLSGGTLSGYELKLGNGYAGITGGETWMGMFSNSSLEEGKKGRCLYVYPHTWKYLHESIMLRDNGENGVITEFNLFGEHNKPRGSYTGNGSNSLRTVSTGGVGCALLVWNTGYASIITAQGAICWYGLGGDSPVILGRDKVYFAEGVLTIITDTGYVNASGVTHSYQVL